MGSATYWANRYDHDTIFTLTTRRYVNTLLSHLCMFHSQTVTTQLYEMSLYTGAFQYPFTKQRGPNQFQHHCTSVHKDSSMKVCFALVCIITQLILHPQRFHFGRIVFWGIKVSDTAHQTKTDFGSFTSTFFVTSNRNREPEHRIPQITSWCELCNGLCLERIQSETDGNCIKNHQSSLQVRSLLYKH